jgi:Family of unknown function (DUF6035)
VSRPRPPKRTLKRVVDVDGYRIITSDELLAMGLADYQRLHRDATYRRLEKRPRYLCDLCGHPVYVSKRWVAPQWAHYKNAPATCPWWTSSPSSIDEVSRRQFQGRQESPLHYRLKYLVAELLAQDGRVSDIVVDERLVGVDGYRNPDVRADFAGRPLAFELQLATTQLPIILSRELFYDREGRHLIWLTWNFEPCHLINVRQAFLDIRTAHNDNLFSMDEETVRESRRRGTFVFRVLWWSAEGCRSKLVTLDELLWPANGLAYAVAPPPPWHTDFRNRWLAMLDMEGIDRYNTWNLLWAELLDAAGGVPAGDTVPAPEDATALIDCLLSLELGRPIGSKQRNLVEVANTFLHREERHRYSKIFRHAAQISENGELLNRPSVRAKLEAAEKSWQMIGGDALEVRIIRMLFPDWVGRKL